MECVTTHLSIQYTLKIDCAGTGLDSVARHLISFVGCNAAFGTRLQCLIWYFVR